MRRCAARDEVTFPSKREITERGYLNAPAIIGRCGVQVYLRGELGLDGDPMEEVRLMRLPEEVFRPETMASFEDMPITDDHPRDGGVDASNWSDEAVGHLRDISRQPGDLLGAQVRVRDGGGVAKVVAGKASLSCGYNFNLDLTPGSGPDGQAFDGYQRDILGDHLAIVDSPRGGPVCRIGDKKKETSMGTRRVIVDGLPLELDEVQAAAVERLVADRDSVVKEYSEASDRWKAETQAKDTEIAGLKTKAGLVQKEHEDKVKELEGKVMTDAQIDELIEKRAADRATVLAAADAVGVKIEAKGKTLPQLRREILTLAIANDETIKGIVTTVVGADGLEKAEDAIISTVLATIAAQSKGKKTDLQSVEDKNVLAAISGGDGDGINLTEAQTFFGADGYRQ